MYISLVKHLRLPPNDPLHPTSIVIPSIFTQFPNLRTITFTPLGCVGGVATIRRRRMDNDGDEGIMEMQVSGVGLDSPIFRDERSGLIGAELTTPKVPGDDEDGREEEPLRAEPKFKLTSLDCVDVPIFSAYCIALVRNRRSPSDDLPKLVAKKELLTGLRWLTLPRLRVADLAEVEELVRCMPILKYLSLDFVEENRQANNNNKPSQEEWTHFWQYLQSTPITTLDLSRLGKKSSWGYKTLLENLRHFPHLTSLRLSGNFLVKLSSVAVETDHTLILNTLSKPHALPLSWATSNLYTITFVIDLPTEGVDPEMLGDFLAETCHSNCGLEFEAGVRPGLDKGWVESVRRRRNEKVREKMELNGFGEGWRVISAE